MENDTWAALLARRSHAGVYGVRTTGIYCRYGCAARPPLRRNAVHFAEAGLAAAQGFRPCLRCQPNTDQPVARATASIASAPRLELPTAFNPGDQTAIEARPGAIAKIPPPTPGFPGQPTR